MTNSGVAALGCLFLSSPLGFPLLFPCVFNPSSLILSLFCLSVCLPSHSAVLSSICYYLKYLEWSSSSKLQRDWLTLAWLFCFAPTVRNTGMCCALCSPGRPTVGFMTHPTTTLNTCQHGKPYPTSRGPGRRRRRNKKEAGLATALMCLARAEICASFESDGRLVWRRVHLQSLAPSTKVCGTTHRSENRPSFSSQLSHLVQVHLFVCCGVYVKWGQTERHALAGGWSPCSAGVFLRLWDGCDLWPCPCFIFMSWWKELIKFTELSSSVDAEGALFWNVYGHFSF